MLHKAFFAFIPIIEWLLCDQCTNKGSYFCIRIVYARHLFLASPVKLHIYNDTLVMATVIRLWRHNVSLAMYTFIALINSWLHTHLDLRLGCWLRCGGIFGQFVWAIFRFEFLLSTRCPSGCSHCQLLLTCFGWFLARFAFLVRAVSKDGLVIPLSFVGSTAH